MRVLGTSPARELVSPLAVPPVDAIEARWAADAIGNLSRQLDDSSVVAVILQRAQSELLSLGQPVGGEGEPQVIGPIRFRRAS